MLSFAIAGVICACAALGLCRNGDDDPGLGLRLHLQLCRVRRIDRLDRRLVADPRIQPGRQRGLGRLVGLCLGSRWSALPQRTCAPRPMLGGMFNFPAMFIIAVVAGLLIYGTRESANAQCRAGGDQAAGAGDVHHRRLAGVQRRQFPPLHALRFRASRARPAAEVGVMAAAAIIFFAFYGFDAIATAAEEAKNPDRDLAIGIVGSMVLCVIIYMAVAAAAIGAVAYHALRQQPRTAGPDPARHRPAAGPQRSSALSAVIRACRP